MTEKMLQNASRSSSANASRNVCGQLKRLGLATFQAVAEYRRWFDSRDAQLSDCVMIWLLYALPDVSARFFVLVPTKILSFEILYAVPIDFSNTSSYQIFGNLRRSNDLWTCRSVSIPYGYLLSPLPGLLNLRSRCFGWSLGSRRAGARSLKKVPCDY